MDLTKEWAYLEEVAAARLKQNKTQFHMDQYGTQIEILGAAGSDSVKLANFLQLFSRDAVFHRYSIWFTSIPILA